DLASPRESLAGLYRPRRCETRSLGVSRVLLPALKAAGIKNFRRHDLRYTFSGAHGRNGRYPAVDQEVRPDDVRRIVRPEVNRQLRDFQRFGDPLAWVVGSEDCLKCIALLFAWDAPEHCRVRRAWA